MLIELTKTAWCDVDNIGSIIMDGNNDNGFDLLAIPKANGPYVKLGTYSSNSNCASVMREVVDKINTYKQTEVVKENDGLEIFKSGIEYAIKIKGE